MKLDYERVKFNITQFDAEDVITTSDTPSEDTRTESVDNRHITFTSISSSWW